VSIQTQAQIEDLQRKVKELESRPTIGLAEAIGLSDIEKTCCRIGSQIQDAQRSRRLEQGQSSVIEIPVFIALVVGFFGAFIGWYALFKLNNLSAWQDRDRWAFLNVKFKIWRKHVMKKR